MRADILGLIVLVGAVIWALRRFCAATGVAAITTLFAAAIWPDVSGGQVWPALAGSLAVIAVYMPSRSVVLATLAGSGAYGAAFAVFG